MRIKYNSLHILIIDPNAETESQFKTIYCVDIYAISKSSSSFDFTQIPITLNEEMESALIHSDSTLLCKSFATISLPDLNVLPFGQRRQGYENSKCLDSASIATAHITSRPVQKAHVKSAPVPAPSSKVTSFFEASANKKSLSFPITTSSASNKNSVPSITEKSVSSKSDIGTAADKLFISTTKTTKKNDSKVEEKEKSSASKKVVSVTERVDGEEEGEWEEGGGYSVSKKNILKRNSDKDGNGNDGQDMWSEKVEVDMEVEVEDVSAGEGVKRGKLKKHVHGAMDDYMEDVAIAAYRMEKEKERGKGKEYPEEKVSARETDGANCKRRKMLVEKVNRYY